MWASCRQSKAGKDRDRNTKTREDNIRKEDKMATEEVKMDRVRKSRR